MRCCLLTKVSPVAPPGRPRRRDGVWRAAAGRPVVRLRVQQPPGPQHVQQDLPVHQVDEGGHAEPLAHLGADSAPHHPPLGERGRGCRGPPGCGGSSIESSCEWRCPPRVLGLISGAFRRAPTTPSLWRLNGCFYGMELFLPHCCSSSHLSFQLNFCCYSFVFCV